MNWSDGIILTILGLFSIRDIIAAFGNIPRNNKWYSKLIYGNYDENLISKVLSDWGFSDKTIKDLNQSLKKHALKTQQLEINNYFERLIFLLAKYTMNFPSNVSYGDTMNSQYYVDTMEASTNSSSLTEMTELMVYLINKSKKNLRPDVIVVPKGGNVELAQSVAMKFNAKLVVVKDKDDDSRARSMDSSNKDCHKVNIEGSWELFEQKKKCSILIDCNTSKGLQLINVVKEFNSAVDCGLKSQKITDVFVLYRVDDDNGIDAMFEAEGCVLNRYLDLNEVYKKLLFDLQSGCNKKNATIYDKKLNNEIESIIDQLKENNMLVFQDVDDFA